MVCWGRRRGREGEKLSCMDCLYLLISQAPYTVTHQYLPNASKENSGIIKFSYSTGEYIRRVCKFTTHTPSDSLLSWRGSQLHLALLFSMLCRHTVSFLLVQLYLGFIMVAIRLTAVHFFPLKSHSDAHDALLKALFHNWNADCWQLLLHIQFDCSAAQTCQLPCLLP